MANILEIIIKSIKQGTGFGDTDREAKGLQKSLDGVNKLLGVAGLAVGSQQAFEMGKAMVEAAQAQQTATTTLESLLGSAEAYKEAIAAIRVETKGTVSETEAAQVAFDLLDDKIASSAAEVGQYIAAGQAMTAAFEGTSLEQFFKMLDQGTAKQLNAFNISEQLVAQRQAEIQQATQMEAAEARIVAIRQLALEKGQALAGSMTDSAIAAKQWEAATTDLNAALGMLLLPQVTESMQNLGFVIRATADTMADLPGPAQDAAQAIVNMANPLTMLNSLIEGYQALTGEAVEATDEVASSTGDAAGAMDQAATSAEDMADAIDQWQSPLVAAGHSIHAVTQDLEKLAQVGDSALAVTQSALDAQAARWAGLAALSKTAGEAGREMQEAMAGGDTKSAAEAEAFEKQQEAAEESAQAIAKSFTSAADTMADRLTSAIENEITPSLQEVWSPGEGEARADEWARRLATVATSGLSSEWITQLQQQFGGQSFFQPVMDAISAGDQAGAMAAAKEVLINNVTQLYDVNLMAQRVKAKLAQQDAKGQLIKAVQEALGSEGITVTTGAITQAAGVTEEATQQAATQVTSLGTTAETAAANVGAAFNAALPAIDTLNARLKLMVGLIERVDFLAKQAGGSIAGMNPPGAPAGGAGVRPPNGAERRLGGMSPL